MSISNALEIVLPDDNSTLMTGRKSRKKGNDKPWKSYQCNTSMAKFCNFETFSSTTRTLFYRRNQEVIAWSIRKTQEHEKRWSPLEKIISRVQLFIVDMVI